MSPPRPLGARLVMLARLCGLGVGLALASPSFGQSEDPEVVFWNSVVSSKDPAEYQTYLDAYPNGRFAALARKRLQPTQSAVGPAPQVASQGGGNAWVRPASAAVNLVRGVVLDMDATGLRNSSNLRLTVVPADAPEALPDMQAFLENSAGVPASRIHLTIPAGPPGRDEVRLYHIPRFAADYALAARAPVTVKPGVPGATLVLDLVREAERLGPLQFEANHRDRPMLIQAAFLRARPRTEWNERWFNGSFQDVPDHQTAVISIGLPNAVPDYFGALGEAVCVVFADDQAQLDKIAGFRTGDPVVVKGVPTSWDSATARDPVVLHDCTLAQ